MKPPTILLGLALLAPNAVAQELAPPTPDALVDLSTAAGARLLGVEWRTARASIDAVEFREAGPDRKPSGPPNRTFDLAPRAGAADFDDSAWEVIAPETIGERRGAGRLSAVWYRFDVRVPERLGDFAARGSTAVLELVVDDYAEVWVDGRLPAVIGERGSVVGGWNAPSRVVLGRDLEPGRSFQVAVLGINGPLSALPSNYVWIRSAAVEFFAAGRYAEPERLAFTVAGRAPELDEIVARDATLERLASGFRFTEGPLWHPGGYLLFSDPNANTIYRWTPDRGVSIWRVKSGYTGLDVARYRQPGSNGLALDREGRVVICEHGNRRVVRQELNGSITVLADRFEGARLNSPNDVVVRSDGSVYFTDPPFGLPGFHDDPARELDHFGVYRWKDGALTLESAELRGPNGIAFSPGERFLYVGNWDEARKVVMRYRVKPDGRLAAGEVFADLTAAPGAEAIDGVKVDERGNVYVSGPGGLSIFAADGRRLGTLELPELPANFAFGGDDGRTLHLTARTGVYRLRLRVGPARADSPAR